MDLIPENSNLKKQEQTNAIPYSSYSKQPSLEQLIDVVRFNNNPDLKDKASKKLIDTYLDNRAYRDLQKMSNDEWIDNKFRNSAKSVILESMLSYYDLMSSESISTYSFKGVSRNDNSDVIATNRFKNNRSFYSFELIAKDDKVNIQDKLSFSEKIFSDWFANGLYINLDQVVFNKPAIHGDISFDDSIVASAKEKIDSAAKVYFSNIKSNIKDRTGDILKATDMYHLLMNKTSVSEDLIVSETLDIFKSLDNFNLFHSFNKNYDNLIESNTCPEEIKDFIEISRESVSDEFYGAAFSADDYISMGLLKQGSSYVPDLLVIHAGNVFDEVVSNAITSYVEKKDKFSLREMTASPFLSKKQQKSATVSYNNLNGTAGFFSFLSK